MTEHDRLLELVGRYADGGLEESELRLLENALKADWIFRREFLRYLNVDAALCGGVPPIKIVQSDRRLTVSALRYLRIPLAIAAVLLVALVLIWSLRPQPRAAPSSYVTLVAANDAVWSDSNVELALRSGDVPPDSIKLDSGSAEFLFADGATMIMRGPVSVRFPARKRVFVEKGRVFCRCPSPESRLSIETPTTEVFDLGTEFAVEARSDRSTLVAVLSGEVQIGQKPARLLHKGEAVEVRGDGVLAIQPLPREEFAEWLLASPSVNTAIQRGGNLLRDPGFDHGLSEQTWNGTMPNIEAIRQGGRSGGAVRITAGSYAQWPQCRQKLFTGDITGKLVVASAWAATPSEAPLHGRQVAMLKLVFVNEQGRDFAFAVRRFLDGKSAPNEFEQAQVAAFAPAGTRQVQIQLMLQSDRQKSGSVIFDDASLIIAEPPSTH